jgi:hypothetical protein
VYLTLRKARNADFLTGQQAYRALDTTIRLAQLMRQDGDDEETLRFRRALEELRVYQVSQQSWQLLSTRVQNQLTLDEVDPLMTRYVFTSVERRFASTITGASVKIEDILSLNLIFLHYLLILLKPLFYLLYILYTNPISCNWLSFNLIYWLSLPPLCKPRIRGSRLAL